MDASTLQRAQAKVTEAIVSQQLSAGAGAHLRRWLTESGYAEFRDRLVSLIDAGQWSQLETAFWEVIPFGTGGRRGLMGDFGSATINARTIAESAHGLAVYLHQVTGQGGGRAVIAHDTRLRSREFAQITASTLAAQGLKVFLFESHRSTPELSFAVRHLSCDVGVMISASHNPPSDNGFKAYWSQGAQVLPPHDKGIINCVYQSNEIPQVDFDAAVKAGQIESIGEAVDRAYIAAVARMSLSTARDLPALFTPLHGVGETSVYRTLQTVGFGGIALFEPHRQPDGHFPNVPRHLPNPELPAVFDPPIALAQTTGAEVILASDPDADRLGVSVKGRNGQFVHLTGNRIGVLIADYILRKRTANQSLTPQHYVVETLVTTPLIGVLAKAAGVRVFDDLLVGFKYIAQTMDREGPDLFVFGAEESLGYLAGHYARDKDASLAALYLAETAAELRLAGKTLLDRLDDIYVEHGYYTEGQRSETCQGASGQALIKKLMEAFTTQPPAELAGLKLALVRDYRAHEIRALPGNQKVGDLPEPQGDLLIFETAPGECQITLAARPSGTEPKIKFYFFARTLRPQTAAQLPALQQQTEATLSRFQDAVSHWVRDIWGAG